MKLPTRDEAQSKLDPGKPYADVPKQMRDLDGFIPSTELTHRALAGHELFGLEDQPMKPRHKVFIALGYARSNGDLMTAQEWRDSLDIQAACNILDKRHPGIPTVVVLAMFDAALEGSE